MYYAHMNTQNLSRNFTTTLPESMLADLSKIARDMAVQKNDILIEAFTQWNKVRTQKLLAESYAKAVHDGEFQALAEDDMQDWGARISKL